eukprot:gene10301-10107_t
MIELGVNIDHVATIRQARRGHEPDPLRAALLAEEYGADAITVHVREDRRHMQDDDCAVVEEMIRLVEDVKPQDVCFVPERREEVTTEGGLDVIGGFHLIAPAVDALPYQLNSTLNMASIMPAHVVYSEVDPMPACFSSFWIQEVLRVKFSFDGAVISDDLDMVGAHGVGDIRK